MGRGRAKAKQRKVARELKYFTPDSDLSALERELRGEHGQQRVTADSSDEYDDEYTEYEDRWASEYDDDENEDDQRR